MDRSDAFGGGNEGRLHGREFEQFAGGRDIRGHPVLFRLGCPSVNIGQELARKSHQGRGDGQLSVLGGAEARSGCVAATPEMRIWDLDAVTGLFLLDRDAIRESGACQGTPRSEAVRGGRWE